MDLKTWVLGWALMMAGAGMALGDELVFANGQSMKGDFKGFQDHRFLFRTVDGKDIAEFAAKIRGIAIDNPPPVSAQFVIKAFDGVRFKGYDRFVVRFSKEDGELEEPVTLLKSMDIVGGDEPQAAAPLAADSDSPAPVSSPAPTRSVPRLVPRAGSSAAGTRDWQRDGKWRERERAHVDTISHGEDVDIGQSLKEGVANVVHFHLASVLSSVRQGNYVETLAGKSKGRVALRRLEIPGWNAPVCTAMQIRSLPQFWFYSRSGRLTRKLTERFTEADIDAALKEALLAN